MGNLTPKSSTPPKGLSKSTRITTEGSELSNLWPSEILQQSDAGGYLSLQGCLGLCGAHRKIVKNKVNMGIKSWGGGQWSVKISRSESDHKIP